MTEPETYTLLFCVGAIAFVLALKAVSDRLDDFACGVRNRSIDPTSKGDSDG